MSGAKLVWHHRSSPKSRGLRLVAPHLADAVVSVSRFALGPAERRLRRARVIYSPINAHLSLNRAEARARLVEELGCPPETFLVGFFGVLIARKRPFAFIDAIAAMRHIEPGTPVVGAIFGEPLEIDEAALAHHSKACSAESAIRLMGFRYPGIDWIAGCDLLLVPAVDEPLGRTLAEAMLVGTPIVATRSGGNAEALEDGKFGTLVEPDDAEAMARAALLLRADSERSNAAAHAAAVAAQRRFGERHHATAIMDLYDEVLGTRSEPHR
jgi:glycosyltransferase involved in cell wall biosynthesis